jgi:hypothetical protein
MSIILSFAALLGHDPIFSMDDLKYPIKYIDVQNAYFMEIRGNKFIEGYFLEGGKRLDNDLPQSAGRLESCSSTKVSCVAIDIIAIVAPKSKVMAANYVVRGITFSFRTQGDGTLVGDAKCGLLLKTGCVPRSKGDGADITYQFTISRGGTLKTLSIQYWDAKGHKVESENLVLVTRSGLRIK